MCSRNILYTINKNKPNIICPVERSLEVIGGKWKIMVIFHLSSGKKRFNELRKLIPNVTQRMLTRQLRELESHGILERKIYAQIPPKVEYYLTDLGYSLNPILDVLHKWGSDHKDIMGENLMKKYND